MLMLLRIEFSKLNASSITQGHAYWFYKQYYHCSTCFSFFDMRVINVWNYLPADTVDFSSLTSFESTIKIADFTLFLKCFKSLLFVAY